MRLPERDSFWWPVLVGIAFTVTELAFVSPRMGLSWDEVVYVSQVSRPAPAAWFDPPRARGVPLLVAPVAFVSVCAGVARLPDRGHHGAPRHRLPSLSAWVSYGFG